MSEAEEQRWRNRMQAPRTRRIRVRVHRHPYADVIPRFYRRYSIDSCVPLGVRQYLSWTLGVSEHTVSTHAGYDYDAINAAEWGRLVAREWRRKLEDMRHDRNHS